MKSTGRILVVAEFGPGSPGGSWVIFKQLLRGLDWGHIYWWSFFKDKTVAYEFGGRHHCCGISPRLSPNRRLRTLKAWALDNLAVPYAARDLKLYIEKIKPDFILFLAHRWGIPVVYRVMPKVKAHWHLSLHDMPDTSGMTQTLGQARVARFMSQTEALYRASDSRDVISPAMAEEMRLRTGMACDTFFRCSVEPELLARLSEPNPQAKDEIIRIGYAGTIIAESTFASFVKALKIAQNRLDRKIEIHLYSWHSYKDRDWYDDDLIIEHGAKSEADIYNAYQQMTWGLAIMHLDERDPRYNNLSFPCKFTAALASGLPLICMGHRDSALMQLAKKYDLGLLLDCEDIDLLAEKISRGLLDTSKSGLRQAERVRCAETEFNAARNREKLHDLMNQAIHGNG